MKLRRRSDDRDSESSLRPISNWLLLLAVVGVVVAGGRLTRWLLSIAAADPNPTASVRIDAIRTGLSAAVGTGGAFALLLAFRRQRSTEIGALHTIADATERRVTELYSKAADQLGSDKAPVRLAGLYALERLAEGNPSQRQTIVGVICAYLQMPYTEPLPRPAQPNDTSRIRRKRIMVDQENERYEKQLLTYEKALQEKRVRMTAVDVLSRHHHAAEWAPRHWAQWSEYITLPGANLQDANLAVMKLASVSFRYANLEGARLGMSELSNSDFTGADLTHADLRGADVTGASLQDADLTRADLRDTKGLSQVQLNSARGNDQTLLPDGLERPNRWSSSGETGHRSSRRLQKSS